jgi:hypothetical protein
LRLLDECVNHDDALTDQETIQGTTNAGTTARPELKQAFSKGARVRQTKAWPMLSQKLN